MDCRYDDHLAAILVRHQVSLGSLQSLQDTHQTLKNCVLSTVYWAGPLSLAVTSSTPLPVLKLSLNTLSRETQWVHSRRLQNPISYLLVEL